MKSFGFSLIELLTSLSIIAILMAISFPALRNFSSRTQDEILQQQLLQSIEFAKREAIARHASVALCQTNNQQTCSGNFADGQMIYIEDEKQILSIRQSSSKHGVIHFRSYPDYRQYLLFLSTGWVTDNASFWHCHKKKPIWAIAISKTGRVRVIDDIHKMNFKC